MARILFTLASLSLTLLATAFVLGLTIGDLYELPHASQETMRWSSVHMLTGLFAALAVVLVESIVVTYFIGTSRWCKEVVETYGLDPALVVASSRLKRRTFPWALAGMLGVVVIISLGGAADPASGGLNSRAWVDWHFAGALLGIVLIAWTYVAAWNIIVANHAIIERIVNAVAQIRRERGLDDSGSAPAASPPFLTGEEETR